jgi:IclR family transcriptional regulator, pca regulon regulatory protein
MNILVPQHRDRQAGEHVQSLARGIAVLRSFSAAAPRQTLADVARATDLTRATARRLLLTLVDLGYARTDGKHFELTPRVLDIGYSFLASLNLNEIVQPYLEALSEQLGESTSVSVLDDTDIVYIARVPTKRIMTVAIGLGSRFPAYQTSMGRVLLADLDDDQIADVFGRSRRESATDHTVRDLDGLLAAVRKVRDRGWSMVDQELELGVRSIAAPIHNATGCTVAAVNVSTQVGRTDLDVLVDDFVPALLSTSAQIDAALGMR